MNTCKFSLGQKVNLTGRLFCKDCGAVVSQGGIHSTFAGHDRGFDVFNFEKPLTCPWCGTVNEAGEQPCAGEPLVSIGVFADAEREAKA